MRSPRTITALAAAGILLAAGASALVAASPASAHTGAETASAECVSAASGTGRVTFNVTNDHPLVATVTASDNAAVPVGATIPKTGSKSFKQTIPAPAAGVTSSATISLRWSDGFAQSGITAAATVDASCTGPTAVVVPELPVTPPTCTVAGSLPWTTNPPAQNPNGYEFPGQGYRVYLSPAYVGAGTYTATVQKIGAGFDPAFPNGSTVTGATSQTLTVLPATGTQSADPSAPCFDRPDQPGDEVLVGTWTDQVGTPSCDVDTVATHRLTTTKPYIWNEDTHTWILDTDETHWTVSDEEGTRPKTAEEIKSCAIVTPPTDEPTPPTGEPTTPAPSDGPTTEPTGSPSPTAGTTPPATQPSGTPSSVVSVPAKTSTAAPVAVSTSAGTDTLAYTGISDGTRLAGILAIALLIVGGVLLIARIRTARRRAGNR